MKTRDDYIKILRLLVDDPEHFPEEDRFRIARSLTRHTKHGILYPEGQMIVDIFSRDKSAEIRFLAGDLLRHMPNVALERLAKQMANDTCRFVRGAVEKSVEHRRRDVKRLERDRQKNERMRRKLRRLGRQLDEKQLETLQEVIEHEQDTVVGKLVHDLRGYVARIDFLTDRMLGERRDDAAFARAALEEIQMKTKYLSQLGDNMRAYSRTRSEDTRPESVESILSEACDVAMDHAREYHQQQLDDLKIKVQCAKCPSLVVTRHEIVTAVGNLLANALDAVVDNEHEGERLVEVIAEPMPRSKSKDVRFVVRDNGIGIHPEMLEGLRVGTVGVTTKRGQGNGFGVAISQKTVEHYRGTFSIESTDGEGTTVTIEMPRRR